MTPRLIASPSRSVNAEAIGHAPFPAATTKRSGAPPAARDTLREIRVAEGALDQSRRINGVDGGTENPPGVRA